MFNSKNQISMLLFSLSLLFMLSYMNFGFNMLIFDFNIMSLYSYDITMSFLVDKVSLLFGVVVTLISSMVFLFSSVYMNEDKFYYRFTYILLSFVISMCILIFSGSLLVVLIGWDGLGITSFALIIYYQSNESLVSGYQTFLINRLGDVLIILSFCFFVFLGLFNFSYSLPYFTGVVFITLAALTKSAQYPFSSWLPAAMAAPTPVSALVHSSTLVTAGIFLIIRMNMILPTSEHIKSLLLLLGSITCFLGGCGAVIEYDLKKIIALSTLSQLGLMVFTLGLGYNNLALFHLFTHALFKALLFISAGNFLINSFGVQDVRYLGSISNSIPFCTVILNVCSMCLMGLPFMSAFYSKHMILDKMLMSNVNMFSFLVMIIASFFTIIYTIRLLKCLVWSKFTVFPMLGKTNNLFVCMPMMVLGFFSIISGKYFLCENWFLEYSLSPSMVFNLFIMFGLLVMMIVNLKINSYMISSLFFMTPLYNYSSLMINPLIKNLNVLDYGWLEFGPNTNILLGKLSYNFYNLLSWPKFNLSFLRMFIMVFLIYMYVNSYF